MDLAGKGLSGLAPLRKKSQGNAIMRRCASKEARAASHVIPQRWSLRDVLCWLSMWSKRKCEEAVQIGGVIVITVRIVEAICRGDQSHRSDRLFATHLDEEAQEGGPFSQGRRGFLRPSSS
jgi:hypothetical protein